MLLAAGRGSRLGELTARFPKPLIEVGGEAILHRILGGLATAGMERVIIVTGHEAEQLEAATGDGARWGLGISYRRQGKLSGTAQALALVRDGLEGQHFFTGWADIVVEPANYPGVLRAAAEGQSSLGVIEVDDPSVGAAVYVDAKLRVTRLVEKPLRGTSSTHWNNAGLMVLTPDIWRFIDALEPSPAGEYELPRAIAALVEAGLPVQAVPLKGRWFDIGTRESLEAARRYFAG